MMEKLLLAASGSALMAISFSLFSPWTCPSAWAGIFLLLLSVYGNRKKAFLTGWAAGMVYFLATLYWIPPVLVRYGSLPWSVAAASLLLLASYLSLYFGLFSWISGRLAGTAFLLSPFLWVAAEIAREKILTGFPWGSLGYTQAENLAFAQLAALGGVRVLAFIMVLTAASLVVFLKEKIRWPLVASLSIVIMAHIYGTLQLKKPVQPPAFKAVLMQGDSSYLKPWTGERIEKVYRQYWSFAEEGVKRGAELLVFPETSFPIRLEEGEWLYIFKSRATNLNVFIYFPSSEITGDKIYNTAYLISPDGRVEKYRKVHLVPFGEYNPFPFLLWFIPRIAREIGDFSPGPAITLLHFRGYPFASPICYEAIFPDLIRQMVLKGATFIVNPTNDSWYGRTSAPYQHLHQARFRAIENRRFLLRAGSTGISALIDPKGRIIEKIPLFAEDFTVVSFSPQSQLTFYTKWGGILNLIYLTGAAFTVILLIWREKWISLKQGENTRS